MTQSQLGEMVGLTGAAVGNYELGLRALTDDRIAEFCRIFGVSADYLLGLSDQPQSDVSKLDTDMLAAYDRAPEPIRAAVDGLLAPYKETKNQEASDEAS